MLMGRIGQCELKVKGKLTVNVNVERGPILTDLYSDCGVAA